MALRSQVPKFGNWEIGEDVPYTAYFEKAKKVRNPKTNNTQIPDSSSNNQHSFQAREEAEIRYGESAKSEKDQDSSRIDLRKSTGSPTHPKRTSRQSVGSDRSFDSSPMHPHHQVRVGNRGSISSEGSHSDLLPLPEDYEQDKLLVVMKILMMAVLQFQSLVTGMITTLHQVNVTLKYSTKHGKINNQEEGNHQ